MKLCDLFPQQGSSFSGRSEESEVSALAYSPRDIKEDGTLFFVIEEYLYHDGKCYNSGVEFVKELSRTPSLQDKVLALVADEGTKKELPAGIPVILVDDALSEMARIASAFYRHPEEELTLIGVTGTNGKTTTTHLIAHLLNGVDPEYGRKTATLGTMGCCWMGVKIDTGFTTPLSLDLFRLFRRMRDDNVLCCVMEVSSHAVTLRRVEGLPFAVKVFTNLTRDHIDFHGSEEEYALAKKRFFLDPSFQGSKPSLAIMNGEDPLTEEVAEEYKGKMVRYGFDAPADCRVLSWEKKNFSTSLELFFSGKKYRLRSSLLGRFNVMNSMAAFCTVQMTGVHPSLTAVAFERFRTVPGRFEQVHAPAERGFLVIIDYAHTPDALENILKSCRELTDKNLLCLFGCGGDRDRGKRSKMGDIAYTLADFSLITSDNPRTEDPGKILQDIIVNFPKEEEGRKYLLCEERREAIKRILARAGKGDIVVIAGKGDEAYQIIGTTAHPFSDREVVRELLSG